MITNHFRRIALAQGLLPDAQGQADEPPTATTDRRRAPSEAGRRAGEAGSRTRESAEDGAEQSS